MLLLTYGALGDVLGVPEAEGLRRTAEAVAAYENAAAIAGWISQRDPSDRIARFDLAVAHMRTAGCLLEEPGGAPKALAHLSREESILTDLVKEDSTNQRYGIYVLVLDSQIGQALQALGRDAEAQKRLEHARFLVKIFRGGPNEKTAVSLGLAATVRLSQMKRETPI